MPRRPWTVSRAPRLASNLGLVILNTLAARFLVPITAVGAASLVETRAGGLLQMVDWPNWVELLLAILLLDLAIYLQHVLFHAVPLFWRLHLVHHVDLDFDVTTGLRFHTLEILLSAWIKLAAIILIGPSVLATILFEVILNATAMFNHGNIMIPRRVDRWLRWVVVTPDMHRVHHSVIHREMNSNFGFNFPWWDSLFGTYCDQPQLGHDQMTVGVTQFRDEQQTDRLGQMLLLPLQADTDRSPRSDT